MNYSNQQEIYNYQINKLIMIAGAEKARALISTFRNFLTTSFQTTTLELTDQLFITAEL